MAPWSRLPPSRMRRSPRISSDRLVARSVVAVLLQLLRSCSARLSSPPTPRDVGPRALVAAQAKFDAGAPDAGLDLLTIAEGCPLDPAHTAHLEQLRAQFKLGSSMVAFSSNGYAADAARRLEIVDVDLARTAHLTALGVNLMGGHLAPEGSLHLAAEVARAAPPATIPRPTDLMLDGLAGLMHAGAPTGLVALGDAFRAFADVATDDEECLQWSWLIPGIVPVVWDEQLWERVAARAVDVARERGALILLPAALIFQAQVRIHQGQLEAASALLEEATVIADAAGQMLAVPLLIVAAWRGQEAVATRMIADAIATHTAMGDGRSVAYFEHESAVLHNGLGHYADGSRRCSRSLPV